MLLLTWPIAWLTGIPEPTLRLLSTIALAYPIARLYNKMFFKDDRTPGPISSGTVTERNAFIVTAGLGLSLFFNRSKIYHSLVTVAVSYGLLYLSDKQHKRKLGTAAVWIFNAVYLLLGYIFEATDDYDVSWTMPQCILCLRLMGFSFDFLDGETSVVEVEGPAIKGHAAALRPTEEKKPPSDLPLSFSNDTPLRELPSFVEVLGYCFFPSAFLVGPQFSFSLYRRWLMSQHSAVKASAVAQEEWEKAQMRYVLRCLGLGILYLLAQQVIGSQYPTSYLLTPEYAELPFLKRIFIMTVSGKFVFGKYLGVWLLTEGATAYFGISYEGDDEHGMAQFGGLANALPFKMETATSIDHVIASFNVNTNLWTKYYVFKRLKFLGNKQLSQIGALAFLALWHGFHANYFTTFLQEFLVVESERVLRKRLVPLVEPYTKRNPVYFYAWKAVSWLTCMLILYYSVIQFDLLKLGKAWTAYKNVYFFGHLAVFAILIADKFVLGPQPIHLRPKKTQ
ncbi:hypothetical protein VTP01DRAFT_2094 [Rhizomucor pusillus]